MREKLETLSLAQLREFGKAQGIKCTGMRKNELIDLLVEAAEKKPEMKPQEKHSAAAKPVVRHSRMPQEEPAETAAEKTMDQPAERIAERTAGKITETAADRAADRGSERAGDAVSGKAAGKAVDGAADAVAGRIADRVSERVSDRVSDRATGRGSNRAMDRTPVKVTERMTERMTERPMERSMERPEDASAGKPGTELTPQQERTTSEERESAAVRSALAALQRDEIPLDPRGRPMVSLETGRQAPEIRAIDSGLEANGILEVLSDGYGFIRCENFLPGENDVYVAPGMIRRFNLKTGDIIRGHRRIKTSSEKFASLLYITSVNGYPTLEAERRPAFENLTPIFPNERIRMENGDNSPLPLRVIDLLAPIGKGQRGMIVSPPKAGKTTLLKQVAKAVKRDPNMRLIILLIDERPEEVTDIKEEVVGDNVEVIYSTFDELPERHKRVSEMVIERAKRLVEYGKDVTILLDSMTRLARAYNLVVPPSGRTLSGGLDPAALHMPKRFFGAARNMREGGSLTILATALIETGSRMDDVIYEEFKGTGNMELVLDRKLSEKRIFPAIDILKSGTRRDDLLLSPEEMQAVSTVRANFGSMKPEESASAVLDLFAKTKNNAEFVEKVEKIRYF